VPNNVVLAASVVPLREPSGIDMRARLDADMKPSEVQRMLDETVVVPTRSDPHIGLEEFDGDEVVVRVAATPMDDSDGPQLADQVVAALSRLSADGQPEEEVATT
jgi:small conductance mechanosensitive channel